MHVVRSRFVTRRDGQKKEVRFEGLARGGESSVLKIMQIFSGHHQLAAIRRVDSGDHIKEGSFA